MQTWCKIVKTRKPHKCWGCGLDYPVGQLMKKVVSIEEGGFHNTYWCSTCELIFSELESWQQEDEFYIGELKEMDLERWEAVNKGS